MNNLKRILSLALASVMVMGMMVVGAGATSYVDDDKIVNKDAVDTLAALNIMNGDERGFRPEDGLTRAEAAKMLATIHNKGVAVNYGTKSTPTFTDIKGHWAEGNVEYAAAFGIANGKGNGIFDPQGSLRVVELARMCLNMMGFDEGKTGSDWELKTTVLATEKGLFKGLSSFLPSDNVTRDQAAQILYNALYVQMDETYTGNVTSRVTAYKVIIAGTGTKSTQAKTAKVHEMSFTSASEATVIAQSFGLEAGAEDNGYTIQSVTDTVTAKGPVKETLAHKYLSLNSVYGIVESVKLETSGQTKGLYKVTTDAGVFYTKTDICSDMMGELVEVLHKSTTSVYGILAAGDVIYEGTVGGLSALAISLGTDNGAILKATSAGEWNNPAADTVDWQTADKSYGAKVALVDMDDDGTPTYTVTITPVKAASVTNMTATTITVNGGVGTKTIDKEITAYTGIAKNDKVVVTLAANTVNGMIKLDKAETMAGVAADAVRTTGEVRINGTWYPALGTAYSKLADMTPLATYDLVMVNGYIVSCDNAQTAASTDLLILTQVAGTVSGLNDYVEARAYFVADGTTQIIKLDTSVVTVTNGTVTTKAESAPDTLLTYTTNTKGYYETKALGAATLGYDAAAGTTMATAETTTTAKIDGKLISESAKIIVMYNKGGNGKVIEAVDAKTVRTWKWTASEPAGFNSATATAFYNNVNGVPYIQFAFINASSATALPGQIGATGNYGYVVSAPYLTTVNGVRHSTYDLWNGTTTIKGVLDKNEIPLAKGSFMEYEDLGNGIINTTGKAALGTPAAITGLNAADEVIYLLDKDGEVKAGTPASAALKLDDKTKIFFVDSKKTEGVATGALDLANIVNGAYVPNVKYVLGGSHVDILIVDVNNAIYNAEVIATNETIKAMGDGVYSTSIKYLPDMGDFNANGKNVFVKFTGTGKTAENANKTYTLTIKNASDVTAYIETAPFGDTNGHFFVVNTAATGDAGTRTSACFDVGEDGAWALKAGTYTVTVSDGTDTIVTGTFTVK